MPMTSPARPAGDGKRDPRVKVSCPQCGGTGEQYGTGCVRCGGRSWIYSSKEKVKRDPVLEPKRGDAWLLPDGCVVLLRSYASVTTEPLSSGHAKWTRVGARYDSESSGSAHYWLEEISIARLLHAAD